MWQLFGGQHSQFFVYICFVANVITDALTATNTFYTSEGGGRSCNCESGGRLQYITIFRVALYKPAKAPAIKANNKQNIRASVAVRSDTDATSDFIIRESMRVMFLLHRILFTSLKSRYSSILAAAEMTAPNWPRVRSPENFWTSPVKFIVF